MSKPFRCLLGTTALALVVGASSAHAALTSEKCFAKKRLAQGKLAQCRSVAEAKIIQGKAANLAKCTEKFEEQIAKLNEKASNAGIDCRFRDNGDGTVSDLDTGLEWEQKNDAGGGANLANPRDADTLYTWSSSLNFANGTAFTDFLSRQNNCTFSPGLIFNLIGLGGHCDWRVPTLAELQTILLVPCGVGSCIDPAFGPLPATATAPYWTRTSSTDDAGQAWTVDFRSGGVVTDVKTLGKLVRAVRGGS